MCFLELKILWIMEGNFLSSFICFLSLFWFLNFSLKIYGVNKIPEKFKSLLYGIQTPPHIFTYFPYVSKYNVPYDCNL